MMKNFTKTDIIFLLFSAGMPISLFIEYCKTYDPIWIMMGYLYYYPIPFIYAVIYAFVTAHKRDIMALFPVSILLFSMIMILAASPIYERYEFRDNLAHRNAIITYIQENTEIISHGNYQLPQGFTQISFDGHVEVVSTHPNLRVAFCLVELLPENGNIYVAYNSTGWVENTDYVIRIIDDNWAVVNSKWMSCAW